MSFVNVVVRYVGFTPDDAWCYATDTNREGVAHLRPSHPGTWVILVRFETSDQRTDPRPIRFRLIYDDADF